jgi:hypothetical protein
MIHLFFEDLILNLFAFLAPIPVLPGTHEEKYREYGGKREEQVREIDARPGVISHFS